MEECRNIPGNVDRIFNVPVRARLCVWSFGVCALVWKRAGGGNFNSACVLAAQWNIWDCSLRRAGATQRHSFFSNPEARKHIPTRTLESGPGHRSFSSSISLFHAASPTPPPLSFSLSTCQPVSPCPCSGNYNHNYQKALCPVIQGRWGVFVWSITHSLSLQWSFKRATATRTVNWSLSAADLSSKSSSGFLASLYGGLFRRC